MGLDITFAFEEAVDDVVAPAGHTYFKVDATCNFVEGVALLILVLELDEVNVERVFFVAREDIGISDHVSKLNTLAQVFPIAECKLQTDRVASN